jgi:hypothetical protein
VTPRNERFLVRVMRIVVGLGLALSVATLTIVHVTFDSFQRELAAKYGTSRPEVLEAATREGSQMMWVLGFLLAAAILCLVVALRKMPRSL